MNQVWVISPWASDEEKGLVCMLAGPTTPRGSSVHWWNQVLLGGMGWQMTYGLVRSTTHVVCPICLCDSALWLVWHLETDCACRVGSSWLDQWCQWWEVSKQGQGSGSEVLRAGAEVEVVGRSKGEADNWGGVHKMKTSIYEMSSAEQCSITWVLNTWLSILYMRLPDCTGCEWNGYAT